MSAPTLADLANQIVAAAAQQAQAAAQQQATDQQQIAAAQAQAAQAQSQLATLQKQYDALLSQTLPPLPADVTFAPDKSYYIAPGGSDATGDGSQANPFATVQKAISQVGADRAANNGAPKLAGIFFKAGGVYGQAGWQNIAQVVFGTYGQASLEQRAVINVTDVGFGWLSAQGIHLQNLRIVGDATNPGGHGFNCQSGDDISADYCEFDGLRTFGVCVIGSATRVRLYHNFIGRTFEPNMQTMSCSGLYTEANAPDVQCNILAQNGWRNPVANPGDPANATEKNAMMFRHGWYENPGNGASVAGTDRHNLYLLNAATGHQCRTGGSHVQAGIFYANGNGSDVFTGAGWNHNLSGEIDHCAVFGTARQDWYFWGGGLSGESVADNIHDNVFLGQPGAMTVNPAILVHGPNGVPAASTTAIVANNAGVWPQADIVLGDGRTATLTGNSIRKLGNGEKVPTLLDCFGVADDAALIELLRTNLHDPKCSARAVYEWARANVPK